MALPFRNGRRQLSQGTLFWQEVGQGPTLLFLHGSWADSSQWQAVMAQLAPDCHCLAPDLLGCGESSRPKLAYSVALQVDCLAEYLAALRQGPLYIVGHSLGAWVATRYALRYPNQVKGLVLLAPEGVRDPSLAKRWRPYRWLGSPFSPLALLLKLLGPAAQWLGLGKLKLRSQHLRRQVRSHPADSRILFRRRPAELSQEQVTNQLATLQMPVLLLDPERANPTSYRLSQIYANLISHAKTAAIPGDETAPTEAAAAIADCIRNFVLPPLPQNHPPNS
jgi:pimeloyl-ACP methyl ester carboxylesterase